MEFQRIRLTDLEQNKGQVKGLPSNPREWTRTDLDHLITSIKQTPELLEARGLIVYPHEGKYIILGGNMRFSALREMNEVDAPCYVMPGDTSIEKLKEIVIKDNGSFGDWDWNELYSNWSAEELSQWNLTDDAYKTFDAVENLPEELQDIDLDPDELAKIMGDDEVLRDRVVITFKEEDRWKVEDMFSIRDITSKVLWRLEEILEQQEEQ